MIIRERVRVESYLYLCCCFDKIIMRRIIVGVLFLLWCSTQYNNKIIIVANNNNKEEEEEVLFFSVTRTWVLRLDPSKTDGRAKKTCPFEARQGSCPIFLAHEEFSFARLSGIGHWLPRHPA